MIYQYPTEVIELLKIRREFYKGIPIITVFEFEAEHFKYGKEAYCHIIKKQIKEVFDFTLWKEKETMPMYFNGLSEYERKEGMEGKITEVNRNYNELYYYFNHEVEAKILHELLEHLQNCSMEVEQAPQPQTKPGRPKTIIQEASYYLHTKELLQYLIENYSNVKPQFFNQLIKVLIDLEQLKNGNNREYKKAFGKVLNVNQSQTNFDNTIKNKPNPNIFNPIKTKITTYLEHKNIV